MTTFVLIASIVFGVSRVLAETSEFAVTTELSEDHTDSEDRALVIRVENSSQLELPDKNNEEEPKRTDKKARTVHRDPNLGSRGSSCCRHGSSGSARPDYNYNRISLESGRYPSQYGDRHPVDRYGWQTQSRPSSSSGSSGRPGGGGGGGGGSGSGVYAGSQSGDRYVSRPVHASETANRPTLGYGSGNVGGYSYGVSGYGSYGRPTGHGGGYGISGTLSDGDEFGPGEGPAYPDGNVPQPAGNIHTQKAVALKALAGVALIGAAAALASNPVLLPIGVVAGRKKRSETFSEEVQTTDVQMDYIMTMLRQNLAKIRKDVSTNRLVVSPRCVARLTCEIQKDYLTDVGKDVEFLNTGQKYHLTNLIQKNILSTNSVSANVKNLIKVAVGVAMENKSCGVFACNSIRKI